MIVFRKGQVDYADLDANSCDCVLSIGYEMTCSILGGPFRFERAIHMIDRVRDRFSLPSWLGHVANPLRHRLLLASYFQAAGLQ